MKKFLSAILAVSMLLCIMIPMASAEIEAITVSPEIGSVLMIEAEDYADQYVNNGAYKTYSIAEKAELSGGKGVYSGHTSNNTETLTLPLSVESDVVVEMECVAGFGGHLDQNYWTLDGEHIMSTSVANGTAMNFKFTAEDHYPAGMYKTIIALTAGTHELTYNLPKRLTMTGAFALDYVKLTTTEAQVPDVDFWDEATVTASANSKSAIVTFSDQGVEVVDGLEEPVNKYLIELYAADTKKTGIAVSYVFNAYTGDIEPYRPETYTVAIPVNNAVCGTYYAKVYPVSSTYATVKGEPIESNVFTIEDKAPSYAKRYEFENYWPSLDGFDDPVVETPYASDGKILLSAQNQDWADKRVCIEDKESAQWQDVYTIEFDVELPKDDTYNIDTVMGKNADKYVDLISVYVDDALIYTNAIENADKNLSVNNNYPWGYLYANLYTEAKELTAGAHKVKVEINRPVEEAQPHLFMLDYIQFTPSVKSLNLKGETVFEMEDYANDFVIFDDAGNTESFKANIGSSAASSNGKYITRDFTPTMGRYPAKVEIPVTVEESGIYSFEAVDSHAGSDGFVTLTDKEGNVITVIEKFSNGVRLSQNGSGLDSADPVRSNFWTYYNIKWHSARKSVAGAYVPAGEYTMTVQYKERAEAPNVSGMAFCIDYIKAIPHVTPTAEIAADVNTVLEMEDFASYFTMDKTAIKAAKTSENDKASGGYLASITETPMKTGHFLTLPIHVEKAGWYDMDSILSVEQDGWTSLVTISVNGEEVIVGSKANAVEDLSETTVADNKETVGYLDTSYRMYRFNERVFLEEGENEVEVFAAPRKNKTPGEIADDEKLAAEGKEPLNYRVGYYIDYISFTPVSETVSLADTTVYATTVYDGETEGLAIVAAYAGKKLVGISMLPVQNEYVKDFVFDCTEAPDSVKIMLVDGNADFKPLEKERIHTFVTNGEG